MRASTTTTSQQLCDSQQLNDFVRQAIYARRLRSRHFPENLFGEPAWDMLLELLHAGSEGWEVTVPDLCEAIGVPGAIALRWLNSLANEGLVVRRPDPRNPMIEIVELEPKTRAAFVQYLKNLSEATDSQRA